MDFYFKIYISQMDSKNHKVKILNKIVNQNRKQSKNDGPFQNLAF